MPTPIRNPNVRLKNFSKAVGSRNVGSGDVMLEIVTRVKFSGGSARFRKLLSGPLRGGPWNEVLRHAQNDKLENENTIPVYVCFTKRSEAEFMQ